MDHIQYNAAKIVFSLNGMGTTGHPHAKKKKKATHIPYTLHKNYFQKVIDLSVRCKTIKLLDYNIGENREDLEYRNDFLHITQRHDPQKKLISWLHYNYKLLLCERQC